MKDKDNKPEGSSFEDLEVWEQEKPVTIRDDVQKLIERRHSELENPNLDFDRWQELSNEHQKMMTGQTENDLNYQLYIYRQSENEPGFRAKVCEIEQKLRVCWCGSKISYGWCHGKQ